MLGYAARRLILAIPLALGVATLVFVLMETAPGDPVELMLAAVNINLISFEAFWRSAMADGQIFAIFVITVAAAEVGIGLGIILMIFRNRATGNVDELDLMKW